MAYGQTDDIRRLLEYIGGLQKEKERLEITVAVYESYLSQHGHHQLLHDVTMQICKALDEKTMNKTEQHT